MPAIANQKIYHIQVLTGEKCPQKIIAPTAVPLWKM